MFSAQIRLKKRTSNTERMNIEHSTSNFKWKRVKKQTSVLKETLLEYLMRTIKNDIIQESKN
jgi:hypothetical protein